MYIYAYEDNTRIIACSEQLQVVSLWKVRFFDLYIKNKRNTTLYTINIDCNWLAKKIICKIRTIYVNILLRQMFQINII